MIAGQEEFKMVSPIFRQNLYVGVFDKYKNHETPINFFDVDEKRYPHTKDINFVNATLNAGDCLYVPAYYYIQSRTTEGKESIFIT